MDEGAGVVTYAAGTSVHGTKLFIDRQTPPMQKTPVQEDSNNLKTWGLCVRICLNRDHQVAEHHFQYQNSFTTNSDITANTRDNLQPSHAPHSNRWKHAVMVVAL